jgi:uncharacterized protein
MNLEILKEIILSSQELKRETGISRQLDFHAIRNKASVFIGVRRSGKTTYLHQIMNKLHKNDAIPQESICYVSFFDERLLTLKADTLGIIIDAYYTLYPEKRNKSTVYYFFDEIQEIQGWETFVSRLMIQENCHVFISGSSAKMLSKEIATQMRGRSLSWEIFPFSFCEFLAFHNIDSHKITEQTRLNIQSAMDDYFIQGGFPETVNIPDKIRIQIHQEYYRTILHRDIIERNDAPHPRMVMDLGKLLLNSNCSLYSLNKLTEKMKAYGHKAVKSHIAEILGWFEDAYFLFSLKKFDISVHKQNINLKKIYSIDPSLAHSVTGSFLLNSGHRLENFVFLQLRRCTEEIYYYKTKNGYEVDFLYIVNSERKLIQVTESLALETTRKREVRALFEAMEEISLSRAFIITRNEEFSIEENNLIIEVIPIWRFLIRDQ